MHSNQFPVRQRRVCEREETEREKGWRRRGVWKEHPRKSSTDLGKGRRDKKQHKEVLRVLGHLCTKNFVKIGVLA